MLGAGKTPIQISEFFMFLASNKKILYCTLCFIYINCLHLPLIISYSLLSIHWPTFSVSLRKMNTVFILKDCQKK